MTTDEGFLTAKRNPAPGDGVSVGWFG